MTAAKAYYDSPLGQILGTAHGDAVTGLWFVGQRYFPDSLGSAEDPGHPPLRRLGDWLDAYWRGQQPPIDLKLAPAGSEFRQAVWTNLRAIPYGRTTTYGLIAQQLADQWQRHVSARAVGGAVSHNPISLVIPCHRVIGASGALTGYAGGLDRKTALLELEGVAG
ncbi:MAG: methylated-DNA--[protein]-cysteine S-methyltransferase [Bifidobacteriaceae bacterium]|jgi:methylated-DNA-[protein]-cysteine S-methyltransferase|nr:methylated-DNA--[protein]-cysteine S-methyltransferase [Bifidobacteriaceae bacterium]